jgi:hypothetical protein
MEPEGSLPCSQLPPLDRISNWMNAVDTVTPFSIIITSFFSVGVKRGFVLEGRTQIVSVQENILP